MAIWLPVLEKNAVFQNLDISSSDELFFNS